MSKCKKCGTTFDENEKFCVNCGRKRESEEEKVITNNYLQSNPKDYSKEDITPEEPERKVEFIANKEPKLEKDIRQVKQNIETKKSPNLNIDKQYKSNETLNTKDKDRFQKNPRRSNNFSLVLVFLFLLAFIGSYLFFVSNHRTSDTNTETSSNSFVNSNGLDSNNNKTIKDTEKKSNSYILPYSNVKPLSKSDLKNMSKEKLDLARNEIFARHGYVFDGEPYKSYFNGKIWYNPDPNFTGEGKELSPLERHNIKVIMKVEGLDQNLELNYDSDYNGENYTDSSNQSIKDDSGEEQAHGGY